MKKDEVSRACSTDGRAIDLAEDRDQGEALL